VSSRRAGRRLAFELLFQLEVGGLTLEEVLANREPAAEVAPEDEQFALELVQGALDHQAEVDTHLKRLCRNWSFERLGNVERVLLRLAAYEMLYRPEIPLVVSIKEALGLAELFGEEKSITFINGILGTLKDEIKSGKL